MIKQLIYYFYKKHISLIYSNLQFFKRKYYLVDICIMMSFFDYPSNFLRT